jgi:hypothetical protein
MWNGSFSRLTGRGRRALRHVERERARGGVVGAGDAHHRRARLRVPAAELRRGRRRRVLHRLDEVVARDRLPVVPLEVEVHAAAERLAPSSVCCIRITSAPFSYTVAV